MKDLVLATIGFAGIAWAIADTVEAHNDGKPGWALVWRGQIILCSILLSLVLVS